MNPAALARDLATLQAHPVVVALRHAARSLVRDGQRAHAAREALLAAGRDTTAHDAAWGARLLAFGATHRESLARLAADPGAVDPAAVAHWVRVAERDLAAVTAALVTGHGAGMTALHSPMVVPQ